MTCTSGTCCGKACADLQTDAANCGRCGHSCQGGACLGGACQVATLATGLLNPYRVAVDGQSVYWTEGGTTTTNGSVKKIPLGGGTPTPLATSQNAPYGLAIDGNNVYWTSLAPSGSGGLLQKVALGGGSPITLASLGSAAPLMTYGTTAFWVDATGIRQVPVNGGAPSLLTSGSSAQCQMATDGTYLYWGSATTIYRVPLSGGTSAPLVMGQVDVCDIVVDGTTLFWTDLIGNVGKAGIDGSSPTNLVTGRPGPNTLTVDATAIYWTENGTSAAPSTLAYIPRAGGSAKTLASWPRASVGMAGGVVSDASTLYWVVSLETTKVGTLLKLAKP